MFLTTLASAIMASTAPSPMAHVLDVAPAARVHLSEDGRIDRVYGKPLAYGRTPAEAAGQCIDDLSDIWGQTPNHLTLLDPDDGLAMMHDPDSGLPKFRRFRYQQHIEGLPVFDRTLTLLASAGDTPAIVLAAADLQDLNGWTPSSALPVDLMAATDRAARAVLGPSAVVNGNPQLGVYATTDEPPRLAIECIISRGQSGDATYAKRRLLVDAQAATVLLDEDLILHCGPGTLVTAAMGDITGSVSGRVNNGWSGWECDDTVTVPLPWAYVSINGTVIHTDADGSFSGAGGVDAVVTSELRGLWFDVNNNAGIDEQLIVSAQDGDEVAFLHNEEESELEMSQAVAYRDANDVRSFVLSVNPDYPTIGTQAEFPVNVNLADTCNAYYDYASINFYQSGGGCNNTAFGHVVYHEYGHHLVAEAGSGQGAYGEGMSDCIALLMTEDPIMGPGFFEGNCVSGIRNADNTCQFQESSCSSCGSEIHACGQLISGCVWDTWDALHASNPLAADQIIRSLTINSILLHTGTAIDDAIAIDFVTLDDDDGDLDNGSPNYDAIDHGFSAHGITVPAIAWLNVSFPSGHPTHVHPNGGTTMDVRIDNQLGSYQPGSAKLAATVDGYTHLIPLSDLGGGLHQATFPSSPCLSTVPYYLWLKTTDQVSVFVPEGGASAPFEAVTATAAPEVVFSDDATSDPGWTVGGDATDGHWERAIPSGGNNRPESDCGTDDWCWLTENRAGGGDDVDGGSTTLTSPRIDATGVKDISYCWWYRNIGGGNNVEDDVWTVNVSDDDGATWHILHQTGTTGPDVAGAWQTSSFSLLEIEGFEVNDLFRIQFVASDLNETSRVEAAVDNVELLLIDCDTPPCPGDLDDDGHVGTNEILAVLDAWGACQDCPADVTGDGMVNVDDILFLVSAFGPCH